MILMKIDAKLINREQFYVNLVGKKRTRKCIIVCDVGPESVLLLVKC